MAFLGAAGVSVDPLRRNRNGATALQLARICLHGAAAAALQHLTEQAARSAGDALIQVMCHGVSPVNIAQVLRVCIEQGWRNHSLLKPITHQP